MVKQLDICKIKKVDVGRRIRRVIQSRLVHGVNEHAGHSAYHVWTNGARTPKTYVQHNRVSKGGECRRQLNGSP